MLAGKIKSVSHLQNTEKKKQTIETAMEVVVVVAVVIVV
jgi:hypothetical protein